MNHKLGLIAGAGELPVLVAQACQAEGRPYYVARLAGMADAALQAHPGDDFAIGDMSARFKALKAAGCTQVALLGIVKRPDFKSLKLDARAAMMLPRVLAAAGKGDDALLRVLIEECEKEGFQVIGADAVTQSLLGPAGAVGALAPDGGAWADINKAAQVAAAMGALDIGQGCVVCDGLVLAVEAAEGTDAMLARTAGLPEAIRGAAHARRGVLVKRPKPIQDRRIDQPVIGLNTLEGAARAGLAGVAYEAGGCLLLGSAALGAKADAEGLFLYGFRPDELA